MNNPPLARLLGVFALAFLLSMAPAARAEADLPLTEAAALLQRISEAARAQSYEGVFVLGHGDRIQTLRVKNRPSAGSKDSRLVILDGEPHEVRCSHRESVNVVSDAQGTHLERRAGTRHFPDLLPENAAPLAEWYAVRMAGNDRVSGLDCQQVELLPKDRYRWGYTLCIDKRTGLPLRAVMVDGQRNPLMQYAFAELQLGPSQAERSPRPARSAAGAALALPGQVRMMAADVPEDVQVRQLPPGFSQVAAMRRTLPNQAGEVRHWVFSDGLTHVSLFVRPGEKAVGMKGNSTRGMINLLTRPLGAYQATVVGDAPPATVELIAGSLVAR